MARGLGRGAASSDGYRQGRGLVGRAAAGLQSAALQAAPPPAAGAPSRRGVALASAGCGLGVRGLRPRRREEVWLPGGGVASAPGGGVPPAARTATNSPPRVRSGYATESAAPTWAPTLCPTPLAAVLTVSFKARSNPGRGVSPAGVPILRRRTAGLGKERLGDPVSHQRSRTTQGVPGLRTGCNRTLHITHRGSGLAIENTSSQVSDLCLPANLRRHEVERDPFTGVSWDFRSDPLLISLVHLASPAKILLLSVCSSCTL
ncbi:uncharacterized protein LOC116575909 [Mustela erminea]|uniref:uncharacterized protein LOC116575909 n=1 Tax=Mustela erminea TaxID=36723 RepID=UPI001386D1FE|nr:uncharacterized protein LOC116575909 [Mustela erminea]